MLENYCKTVNIEALTMMEMVRTNYLPAIREYLHKLARTNLLLTQTADGIKDRYGVTAIRKLSGLTDRIMDQTEALEEALDRFKEEEEIIPASQKIRDEVLPAMEELRQAVDKAEMIMPEQLWPFPGYGKILFSVH